MWLSTTMRLFSGDIYLESRSKRCICFAGLKLCAVCTVCKTSPNGLPFQPGKRYFLLTFVAVMMFSFRLFFCGGCSSKSKSADPGIGVEEGFWACPSFVFVFPAKKLVITLWFFLFVAMLSLRETPIEYDATWLASCFRCYNSRHLVTCSVPKKWPGEKLRKPKENRVVSSLFHRIFLTEPFSYPERPMNKSCGENPCVILKLY